MRLCVVFLRHIFAVAGTLRVPLSQPQKRRKTAGTLNDIKTGIIGAPPSMAARRGNKFYKI
jgi:hypothetical protein